VSERLLALYGEAWLALLADPEWALFSGSNAENVWAGKDGFLNWESGSGLGRSEEGGEEEEGEWGVGVEASTAMRMTLKQRYKSSVSCTQ